MNKQRDRETHKGKTYEINIIVSREYAIESEGHGDFLRKKKCATRATLLQNERESNL